MITTSPRCGTGDGVDGAARRTHAGAYAHTHSHTLTHTHTHTHTHSLTHVHMHTHAHTQGTPYHIYGAPSQVET